jgi:hypothetical protein
MWLRNGYQCFCLYKTSHCAGGDPKHHDPKHHDASRNDAFERSQENLVWKRKDADWLSTVMLLTGTTKSCLHSLLLVVTNGLLFWDNAFAASHRSLISVRLNLESQNIFIRFPIFLGALNRILRRFIFGAYL